MKPFLAKALVGTLFVVSLSVPTAHGLELPATTRLLNTPAAPTGLGANLISSLSMNLSESAGTPASATGTSVFFASEMAKVALASQQSEMARTSSGAKQVAKQLMADELNWGDYQFSCLNKLWTKESHWNYQAHNYRSGAHGIAQALPATKMEIIGTDWRTNPVTQILWGLHYIELRYETPCKAWKKFKRSRYY